MSIAFDKEQFTTVLDVLALRVPARLTGSFVKSLSSVLLNRPRIKSVTHDEISSADTYSAEETRLVLLNEIFTNRDLSELPDQAREFIQKHKVEVVSRSLKLDYSYWNADQVLQRILPPEIEPITAFETIGNVIHVNLREEHAPYKALIGQVLLEKNAPRIRTVVNKVSNLENEFRVMPLEILAGDPNLETEVHEQQCRFFLNFGEVYWNSRLENEHRRLVSLFKPSDRICDMFAGIGPFAIPAAKRGCFVYANDLNPRSYHYLLQNIKANKVGQRVEPYNMDGREFVRRLLDGVLRPSGTATTGAANDNPRPMIFEHVVMNLPASATDFLDVFRESFRPDLWGSAPLPLVHCYSFTREADVFADSVRRVTQMLGVAPKDMDVFHVRDVAPNKHMVCMSFRVPAEIAFLKDDGGPSKRPRVGPQTG